MGTVCGRLITSSTYTVVVNMYMYFWYMLINMLAKKVSVFSGLFLFFQAWWNGNHHRGGTGGVWRDKGQAADSAREPDYTFQVRAVSKSTPSMIPLYGFLLGCKILEIRLKELNYKCIILLVCNTNMVFNVLFICTPAAPSCRELGLRSFCWKLSSKSKDEK